MPLVLFIVFESLPRVNKKLIDAGDVTRDEAALCDIVRSTFFLSHEIRGERELWCFFSKDALLARIDGQRVRYMGPDERSILMLFMKLNDRLGRSGPENSDAWTESTPGIEFIEGISFQQGIHLLTNRYGGFPLVSPTFLEKTGTDAPIVAVSGNFLDSLKERGVSCVLLAGELEQDIARFGKQINDAIRNALFGDVVITTRIRLNDLPTKIMVLNLIEDNLA